MARVGDRKVAYKVGGPSSEHEKVHVGSVVTSSGDRCARLTRFGRPVATFLLSSLQLRSLRKGKRINIANASINLAETYGCTTSDGGLRDRRRRER